MAEPRCCGSWCERPRAACSTNASARCACRPTPGRSVFGRAASRRRSSSSRVSCCGDEERGLRFIATAGGLLRCDGQRGRAADTPGSRRVETRRASCAELERALARRARISSCEPCCERLETGILQELRRAAAATRGERVLTEPADSLRTRRAPMHAAPSSAMSIAWSGGALRASSFWRSLSRAGDGGLVDRAARRRGASGSGIGSTFDFESGVRFTLMLLVAGRDARKCHRLARRARATEVERRMDTQIFGESVVFSLGPLPVTADHADVVCDLARCWWCSRCASSMACSSDRRPGTLAALALLTVEWLDRSRERRRGARGARARDALRQPLPLHRSLQSLRAAARRPTGRRRASRRLRRWR